MKRYIVINDSVVIDVPGLILDILVCILCPPLYLILSELAAVKLQRQANLYGQEYEDDCCYSEDDEES